MAYFIPSYIQKRILRYALSRVDLLDIDALDLDKADIVIGKKSTFELQDVGLRLKVRERSSLGDRVDVYHTVAFANTVGLSNSRHYFIFQAP